MYSTTTANRKEIFMKNSSLILTILCSIFTAPHTWALSLNDIKNALNNLGTSISDNKVPLTFAGLAIANHHAKNRLRRLPNPNGRGNHIFSMSESIVSLGLAFGLQDAMRGDIPIKKSLTKLGTLLPRTRINQNNNNNDDPVEVLFFEGGKVLMTTGALYKVGKYVRERFR
jgi:hypothetical protein